MSHFVDEITRLREALGLRAVHLYGHSWGTNVAVDYMLRKPAGVRSVTLAGALLDATRYHDDVAPLVAALPDSVQSALIVNERNGTTGSAAYQHAFMYFLQQYHIRRQPWSADVDSSVAHVNARMNEYLYGPGVIDVGGAMRSYRRGAELRAITVPTLFTIGRYDYTSAESARYYQSLIPGSRVVVFEASGHLTMHDEPDRYLSVIRSFLASVER